MSGRRAHHDDLDRLIGGWTGRVGRLRSVPPLPGRGRAGRPCARRSRLPADPHCGPEGSSAATAPADLGEWEFPNHLWRWNGPALQWGPLCRLGADNEYVYRTVMGLTDAEYQALADAGHLSADYLQPDGTPF